MQLLLSVLMQLFWCKSYGLTMASLLKSFPSLMITRCAGYDHHHPPQPSRPMAFAMGNTPEGARLGKFPFFLRVHTFL